MKTHKKIFFSISLTVFLILGVVLYVGAKKVFADALDPNLKFNGACVDRVSKGDGGGPRCLFFNDDNHWDPSWLYGGGNYEVPTIVNATEYKASYEQTTVSGGGKSVQIPSTIELLDQSDQLLGSPEDSVFHYSKVGGEAPVTKVDYFIYKAKDQNFSLLLSLNTNGDPPTILNLVNETVRKDPYNNDNRDGTVWAYGINQPVLLSTSTGGVIHPASSTTPSGKTCESNFNSGFEWVICPALGLADSAAGAFNSFVEGQLCFQTGPKNQPSSTGGVVCDGKNNLNNKVKASWAIFKNIATALLVIILLAAVIAQAFGGGPFDAYTIRKLLPKIVAAVILMQLSWFLFKWLIDLSNDAGFGIRDLLFAPFGGESHLTLEKIMGSAFSVHTTGTNDTFAFFTVLAAGTAAFIVSVPTIVLLALYAVLALLTAFLVLVFRKLLIILLVILAPVALILWILPGTEEYWKLWRSNFTKLLLMFPMIMALIAAGKIFASITAGNATMFRPHLGILHVGPLPLPYTASVTSFADLLIIIAAYFAPYFLLPKTFSWGGAAMGAIAKGVQAGVERGSKPAKEYLNWRQGLSPWRRSRALRKAEVERRAGLQYANRLQGEGLRGRVNRIRLGGVGLPNREAELRRRVVQTAEAEVEKNRREDIQRATIQLTQRDLAGYNNADQDLIRKAIISGEDATLSNGTIFNGEEYAGTHPFGRRAALDRGVIHGHMREIESWIQNPDTDQAEVNDFLQQNSAALGDQMTHLLKGMDIAARSKPENIVKMRQEEVESILGTLSSRSAAGDATAQDQLSVFLRNYAATATDNRWRGQLDQGGARAMKAFVDNNSAMLNVINSDPAHGGRDGRARYGLPLIEGGAVVSLAHASPEVSTATRSLSDSIDEDGVIRTPVTPSAPSPPPPPPSGTATWTPTGGSSTPT